MKLVSWNVNGIRAVLQKGFSDFVEKEQPDILCLQETKAHPDQVDKIMHDYPYQYWNSAVRKGYAGTAVFSKIRPGSVKYNIGIEEFDQEGRVITLEFSSFYLLNVYTPNSQDELRRLPYRVRWDAAFLRFLKRLEKKKPIVCCGDMNVAHKEIDLARPRNNRRNAGFTDEERQGFTKYVEVGFLDTFREFHPEPHQYSWWSYRMRARDRNVGWRIDYVIISQAIRKKLQEAFILQKVLGSDHCPVGIILQ